MTRVAFVAGATGYTGREVVRAAVEAGLRTIAHVRRDSPRRSEWERRFLAAGAEVDATAWTEAAMRDRLSVLRPDIVFALLGTTRARGRAATGFEESYETVDFGLTVLLLDAARAAGSRPRFCYLSAAGAGAGRGAYYRARRRAEERIRKSGLPWTVARPSLITGPDRDDPRLGETAGAALSDALLGVVGALGGRRLRERYRSTDAATLARALVRLALDPAAQDRIVEGEGLRG